MLVLSFSYSACHNLSRRRDFRRRNLRFVCRPGFRAISFGFVVIGTFRTNNPFVPHHFLLQCLFTHPILRRGPVVQPVRDHPRDRGRACPCLHFRTNSHQLVLGIFPAIRPCFSGHPACPIFTFYGPFPVLGIGWDGAQNFSGKNPRNFFGQCRFFVKGLRLFGKNCVRVFKRGSIWDEKSFRSQDGGMGGVPHRGGRAMGQERVARQVVC
jgi:hypothetical protein